VGTVAAVLPHKPRLSRPPPCPACPWAPGRL